MDIHKLVILTNVSIFIYANLLNTDNLILLCMCEACVYKYLINEYKFYSYNSLICNLPYQELLYYKIQF